MSLEDGGPQVHPCYPHGSLAALRRALASGDEHEARRAVRACAERLRIGAEEERRELLETVVPLARHASPIVRLAVASVCDSFPERAWGETHALLLADLDRFVRAAADAAGHRRAQRRRDTAKGDAEERVLAGLFREIEDRHGKGARRLAERAVERGVEHFAAQLEHEVRKTSPAIHVALAQLLAEVERPERSLGLVGEHAGALRGRLAFVFSIVRRAREYASRVMPAFAEESLSAVVEEARAQLVLRLDPARRAKLAFSADVDGRVRAEIDRHSFLQALQNVLQNAAEAYEDGAPELLLRVSAHTRRGESEIELSVADDGVGIRDDQRRDLFVPFGSQKPGGTGVGLLIVRRMVEDVHGGELAIESAPGRGTTVRMVIPVKQARR